MHIRRRAQILCDIPRREYGGEIAIGDAAAESRPPTGIADSVCSAGVATDEGIRCACGALYSIFGFLRFLMCLTRLPAPFRQLTLMFVHALDTTFEIVRVGAKGRNIGSASLANSLGRTYTYQGR